MWSSKGCWRHGRQRWRGPCPSAGRWRSRASAPLWTDAQAWVVTQLRGRTPPSPHVKSKYLITCQQDLSYPKVSSKGGWEIQPVFVSLDDKTSISLSLFNLFHAKEKFPKISNMSEFWDNVYKMMHKTSRIFPFDEVGSAIKHMESWVWIFHLVETSCRYTWDTLKRWNKMVFPTLNLLKWRLKGC